MMIQILIQILLNNSAITLSNLKSKSEYFYRHKMIRVLEIAESKCFNHFSRLALAIFIQMMALFFDINDVRKILQK